MDSSRFRVVYIKITILLHIKYAFVGQPNRSLSCASAEQTHPTHLGCAKRLTPPDPFTKSVLRSRVGHPGDLSKFFIDRFAETRLGGGAKVAGVSMQACSVGQEGL